MFLAGSTDRITNGVIPEAQSDLSWPGLLLWRQKQRLWDDSTTPPAMAMAVYQQLHDAVSPQTADANLRRQWKDAILKISLWR